MYNFNIFICFGIILRNIIFKNKLVVILIFYKVIYFDYYLLWNNVVKDYFLCIL